MKTIEKKDNKLIVHFGGPDFKSGLSFCKLNKLRWNPAGRQWETTNIALYPKFIAMGYTDPYAAPIIEEKYIPCNAQISNYRDIQLNPKLLPDTIRGYQREAVQFALHRNRTILALDPGLGKSLVGSVYAAHLDNQKYTIIVCPASLKTLWKNELLKWSGAHAEILEGLTPYTPKPISDYLVINYDILGYSDPIYLAQYKESCRVAKEKDLPKPTKRVPLIGWANYLQGKIGCIISDESQYLGDISSIRVKQFIKMAKTTTYITFLSGTPVRHRLAKFWTQISTCDSKTFASHRHYLTRYCDPKGGFRGLTYHGATHVDELHDKIKPFVFHRCKADVAPELPKKHIIMNEVDVADREFMKLNTEAQDKSLKQIERNDRMKRLIRSAYHLKRQFLFDKIDELLENDEKVVLVAFHRDVVEDLAEQYKCKYINGSVASEKRQAIVDAYDKDDKQRVIVLQLQAGGVGFSILSSCNMVFCELYYVFSEVLQIMDRLHRLTSTWGQVNYYFYPVSNSCEIEMVDSIRTGSGVASEVITGDKKELI